MVCAAAVLGLGAGGSAAMGAAQQNRPALEAPVTFSVDPALGSSLSQAEVDRVLAVSPVHAERPVNVKVLPAKTARATSKDCEQLGVDLCVFWARPGDGVQTSTLPRGVLRSWLSGYSYTADAVFPVNQALGQGPAALTSGVQVLLDAAANGHRTPVQWFSAAWLLGLGALTAAGWGLGLRRRATTPVPHLDELAQRAALGGIDDPAALRPHLRSLLLEASAALEGEPASRARGLAQIAGADAGRRLAAITPFPAQDVDRITAALTGAPEPDSSSLTAATLTLAAALPQGEAASPGTPQRPTARLASESFPARVQRLARRGWWPLALCVGLGLAAGTLAPNAAYRLLVPSSPTAQSLPSIESEGPGAQELLAKAKEELDTIRSRSNVSLRVVSVAPSRTLASARADRPTSADVVLNAEEREALIERALGEAEVRPPLWKRPDDPAAAQINRFPRGAMSATLVYSPLADGSIVFLGARTDAPSRGNTYTWDRLVDTANSLSVTSADRAPGALAEAVRTVSLASSVDASELTARVPFVFPALVGLAGGLGTAALLSWAWALWPGARRRPVIGTAATILDSGASA